MPPVIGAVILGAIGISAETAVLGTTLGTLVGYAVLGTATIGLGLLLNGDQKQKTNAEQQTVRQGLPTRQRVYGEAKLGGAIFFLETSSASTFVQGVVHCEGPIDSFQSWWLNDLDSGLADHSLGGVNTVAPWNNLVTIESHLGATDQAASGVLLTSFGASHYGDGHDGGGGTASGAWTTAHQLKGLAYSVICHQIPDDPEKNFQKFYPQGPATLRVVVRGAAVFDPRSNATGWSCNPALCILDYLMTSRGYGLPSGRMNLGAFASFADLCDEAVGLAAGGTEPRYWLGGAYDLTDAPKDILRRLLDACDAELVPMPDGTVGIRGGAWTPPSVVITDDMVVGYEYQQANDKLAAYNRLKLTYMEPGADYQQIEATPWDDPNDQALQGVLIQDFPLPFVQSHAQSRRLAKIKMAKDNPRHKLTLSTNLAGLVAAGERTVTLQLSELLINEPFLVTSFTVAPDLSGCTIGLCAFDGTAYDWNPAVEEGASPAYTSSEPTLVTAPAPSGIAVEAVQTSITSGGTAIQARATSAEPTDSNAAYWVLIGQYRQAGATDWIGMTAAGDDAVITDYLSDGQSYEIQVAFQGLGTQSAWTPAGTIAAVADPTAPAQPHGLSATASGTTVTVAWTNPGSGNFGSAHVYRSASSDFGSATRIATAVGSANAGGTYSDAGRPAGTWYYFVTAANRSGVESGALGPVSVTV